MKTREKILEASLELFTASGYEGTSLGAIADKVGIKKPSLYAHFKNKEAIFLEAVEIGEAGYHDLLKRMINEQKGTAAHILRSLLEEAVAAFEEEHLLSQFYYRFLFFPPSGLEEKISSITTQGTRRLDALLADIIERGQEEGELTTELTVEQILRSYLCMLGGTDFDIRYYQHSSVDRKAYLEMIWSVFWRGVKA
ncbi:TetR/AcrR family transcriptional regulator [Alkalicoccus luteus]|uniref:TetR/AcrR family transcriptional regulator n=1 Tax=Alkalicoccus luteus TaxID=1237094 RepID=UPI00403332CF